eukprot:scaffold26708_cov199-Skeletonema_menzelii.AAC.1
MMPANNKRTGVSSQVFKGLDKNVVATTMVEMRGELDLDEPVQGQPPRQQEEENGGHEDEGYQQQEG